MAKSVEELHEKLMDEYGQVRRKFDQIHTASSPPAPRTTSTTACSTWRRS